MCIRDRNNTVGQYDIVFHLGDFCLGGSAEWTKMLDRLNGKIYLIMGTHDLKNIRQGYIDRFEHVAMQMHIEAVSYTHLDVYKRQIKRCSRKSYVCSIRKRIAQILGKTIVMLYTLFRDSCFLP